MFCSKCGKEIMDEAIVCPNCGCATSNYISQQPTKQLTNNYSDDYITIRRFAEQALVLRNLGIVAAILMFGIGIIFTIIIAIKQKENPIPEITTTNPAEIAEFELAKRRYNVANVLASLPIIGIALCICIFGICMMFASF